MSRKEVSWEKVIQDAIALWCRHSEALPIFIASCGDDSTGGAQWEGITKEQYEAFFDGRWESANP